MPDEVVELKDDLILSFDRDTIITKWTVLKPRDDFYSGLSCYFVREGIKVSKIFALSGECLFVYCDIIETEFDAIQNAYIFHDLLIDVIVRNDGTTEVLDLAEISDALDQGLITMDMAKTALRRADALLCDIYKGQFNRYTQYLDMLGDDYGTECSRRS